MNRPPTASTDPPPTTIALVAAFAAVYLIWGSTYLAILIAIETLPPFLMAAARFLAAGLLLFGWARARGAALPDRGQIRDASIVGALLLFVGNGGVVWAEQYVPSGLVALLVATVPFWMVLLDWGFGSGVRPRVAVWGALALGLAGVAVLASAEGIGGGGDQSRARIGAVVVLGATLAWSIGSIFSRGARLPRAPRMATAVQMIAGGLLLLLLGTALGEWRSFAPASVSLRSWLALAYLVVFGSLVAFSAYIWLLRVSTPARVATYAYVNPVVALLLGWAFAGEPLGARTFVAAGLILASVAALSVLTRPRRTPPAPAALEPTPADPA